MTETSVLEFAVEEAFDIDIEDLTHLFCARCIPKRAAVGAKGLASLCGLIWRTFDELELLDGTENDVCVVCDQSECLACGNRIET